MVTVEGTSFRKGYIEEVPDKSGMGGSAFIGGSVCANKKHFISSLSCLMMFEKTEEDSI